MKAFAAFLLYALIGLMLYTGTALNAEHEEIEALGSLICFSCIGIN